MSRDDQNHRSSRRGLRIALLIAIIVAAAVALVVLVTGQESGERQARLQPFYDTAGLSLKGPLGEVVRSEPLGGRVEGGSGLRILYRTERADGSITFSSGRLFIPDSVAPRGGRPVVAWAHGTLGLGDSCAPSRARQPAAGLSWLSDAMSRGWVVTATDYAGFGTPGVQGYLVGDSEAHDVLNSVRAARNVPEALAAGRFAIWGHSQGGNSALFSAKTAERYAPGLRLVGTVASAPAAELVTLLNEQYGSAADWVIGPLVATSWPAADPRAERAAVLSNEGQASYAKLAQKCIGAATAAGLARQAIGEKFFARNPMTVAPWRVMAKRQSAPTLGHAHPLMVVESDTDKVVPPNTTALYIRRACRAGSDLQAYWLRKAAHQQIPARSAATVVPWIADRFAGGPTRTTCNLAGAGA